MSNFIDSDIEQAFRIWPGRITSDPTKWQHGFMLDDIDMKFHNLLQRSDRRNLLHRVGVLARKEAEKQAAQYRKITARLKRLNLRVSKNSKAPTRTAGTNPYKAHE